MSIDPVSSLTQTCSLNSSSRMPSIGKTALWIGGAIALASVAYAFFRYISTDNHSKNSQSGDNVSIQPSRLVKAVEVNETLVDKVLAQLFLSREGKLKFPKEGRIATNVIVKTKEKGDIMLRLYPEGCQSTKLETGNVNFEVEALQFFASRGIPVPNPLIFANHKSILEYAGAKIFAYSVLPGSCLKNSDLSVQVARDSGLLLKNMIEVSENFKPQTTPAPEGDVLYILGIYEKCLHRNPQLKNSEEFKCMAKAVVDSKVSERIATSPMGIVHGDFFFENLVKGTDRSYSVIDFGDAYYGHVVMDIVTSSMEFSVLEDGSWDWNMFKASVLPHNNWLKKHKIDFELFYDLLIANCLRFAIYTIPSTLKDHLPIAENPYVSRFNRLQNLDFKAVLKKQFNEAIS